LSHLILTQRVLDGPEVSRKALSPDELRRAFTFETTRSLRRSDGTISLEGRRYEIPSTFHHMKRISIRYADWDLSTVFLVNQRSGDVIGRIYPRDLEKNADGIRRSKEAHDNQWKPTNRSTGMAPLLQSHLVEYAATGLPMNYIPKGEKDK